MRDAWSDLLLGSACVGCARPGRRLCPRCRAALPRGGSPAWPTPAPPGLVPPFAAGAYDGVLKAMVNAHKEEQALALTRPLGAVLAGAVADLLAAVAPGVVPVLLVPVPSRRSVVRRRGHDPLLRMTRRAAAELRAAGRPSYVLTALRSSRPVRDQAGLGEVERAANLAGSMRARPLGRVTGAVVVVDDVLTTGSTVREAQRALEDGGLVPVGVATVAATRRRSGVSSVAGRAAQPGGSLPLRHGGG